MSGKGGIRVGKKERGITINMNSVGGAREGCTIQRRQVVILQHLTMLKDSDCELGDKL